MAVGEKMRARLVEWTVSRAFEFDDITYKADPSDVIDTASVIWPDGSTGTWTTTAFQTVTDYANLLTGYTLTHEASGLVVTQPPKTLTASGLLAFAPELIIQSASAGFGAYPFGTQPFGA